MVRLCSRRGVALLRRVASISGPAVGFFILGLSDILHGTKRERLKGSDRASLIFLGLITNPSLLVRGTRIARVLWTPFSK